MKKKSIFRQLLNVCAYTHLIRFFKTVVIERKFPNNVAKQGAIIMTIGICCPIFWVSLITGAKAETVRFNAIHSGVVALLGMIIMIVGFLKNNWFGKQEVMKNG
jgi:hypothetical protein